MALFQKKPHFTSSAPLYTVGASRTVLVVGLGNKGVKYDGTRHNIGFAALDDFAKVNEFPKWVVNKNLKAELVSYNLGSNRVILAKPTAFMNLSGESVGLVQQFYKIPNSQTLAVYDELAIPFGQIRTRVGGNDAGHNGVKSLVKHIGSDFGRLRIGIDNETSKKSNASDFVLKKFSKEEKAELQLILQESSSIITEYIFGGDLPHDTRTVI